MTALNYETYCLTARTCLTTAETVIGEVVDDGEFLEYHAGWAGSIVCGFGRIDGRSVGIVGNQPMVMAGVLDIESSEKAARFVRFATHSICPYSPLLMSQVSSLALTKNTEASSGMARSSFTPTAKPRFPRPGHNPQSVRRSLCRNGFQVGGLRCVVRMANSRTRRDGSPGAVEILNRRELQQAADPEARKAELVDDYTENCANPYVAAERGIVDAVIDPAGATKVVAAFRMIESKREELPKRKHGNVPL